VNTGRTEKGAAARIYEEFHQLGRCEDARSAGCRGKDATRSVHWITRGVADDSNATVAESDVEK